MAKAPQREKEDRALLMTAPGVGFVTAEVVLSELGGYEPIPQLQDRLCLRGGGAGGAAERG